MAVELFRCEDATHDDIHLLIGLSAPSGGGKSHTALRMAWGIQQYALEKDGDAGPIVLIDTDNGRGRMLAPRPGEKADPPHSFDFRYLRLSPPFAPNRFDGALEAAKKEGPAVLVIDNISDEWYGEGGILEYVSDEQAKGGNQFAAWNKPKRAHKAFMATLHQLQCPVILNIMAEDKFKTAKGSTTPVHVGWTPIAEKLLPRALTFHFLVGVDGKPGQLTASREEFDHAKAGIGAADLVKDGEMGDETIGRRLAAWAAGEKQGGTE